MNILKDMKVSDIPVMRVSRIHRIGKNSSSAGNQLKWHKDNIWVKANLLGYENIAEVVVSHFLSYTNLQTSEYVRYYGCIIEEDGIIIGNGCYSYDYITPYGYEEVTVTSILDANLEPYSINYDELRLLLYDYLHYDPKVYLDKMLCVDAIIRNCDRHFNNIALLLKDGVYTPSPLYDHGDSCLSDLITYPLSMAFEDAFEATRIAAKPFRCDFVSNLVDNNKLIVRFDEYKSSLHVNNVNTYRAVQTILRGLQETEDIAWVRN